MTRRRRAVGNVADREQVDEVTRSRGEREQANRANVRKLLATPEGRAVGNLVIRLAEAEAENPFAGEATHTTAFNCGMLAVAQTIRRMFERYAPELYILMRNEAVNQETT